MVFSHAPRHLSPRPGALAGLALALLALLAGCGPGVAGPPPTTPQAGGEVAETPEAEGPQAEPEPSEELACPAGPAPAPRLAAGPLWVSYVHPEGRWMALCQSPGEPGLRLGFGHHGESPASARPSLVWAEGAAEEVEGFVAVGPRGRWVLVRRAGALVLVDAEARAEVALRPLHAEDEPGRSTVDRDHPSASFDRGGRRLAYMRWGARPEDAVAVVRELATGSERSIGPPPGHRLLGAQIDRDGAWLWTWSAPSGRAVRASVRLGGRSRQCSGPARTGAQGGLPAPARDALARAAVALEGEGALRVPEATLGWGDSVVARAPDGAFSLVRADGTRAPLAPASCAPLGLHAGPQALAILCRSSGEVQIWEGTPPRASVTYAFERPPAVDEEAEWAAGRWLVRDGRAADLEGRSTARVPAGFEVLAEEGGRLLLRGGHCELEVLEGEARIDLGVRSCDGVYDQAGPYVRLGDLVVDLIAGRSGLASGPAWGLHESGAVLVSTPRYPLLWERIHFAERPCPCRTSGAMSEAR